MPENPMSECKDCRSKRDQFDEYNNPDWTCPNGCDEASRDPLTPEEVAIEFQDLVDNDPYPELTETSHCWTIRPDGSHCPGVVLRTPHTEDYPYGNRCPVCDHSLRYHPYYGKRKQDDMELGSQRTFGELIFLDQTEKMEQKIFSIGPENQISKHADNALNLVEEIVKQVEPIISKVRSSIRMPSYPKKLEQGLRTLAKDEVYLRNFSNHIYMLFIDGHSQLMNRDSCIISKSEFLQFAGTLYYDICNFRLI